MLKVVIIGCSTAGMTAAMKIKSQLKDEVEVIGYQKLPYPSLKASGLPYYVAGYYDDERMMVAYTVEEFAKGGIDVRTSHEVLSVDSKNQIIKVRNMKTGEEFEQNYDRLIISTGAIPKTLDIPGSDASNVATLNNIEDGRLIRSSMDNTVKRIVVIGGGYIGLEMTEAFIAQQKEVTLVEGRSYLSADYYDEDIAGMMQQHLVKRGVKLHFKSNVVEIIKRKDGYVKAVRLEDDTEIPCDFVVETIGVKPNTAWLANTGIKMEANGAIIVDRKGKTNVENIFAGGDCAMTFSRVTEKPVYAALATAAAKQGKVIGNVICDHPDSFPGILRTTILRVFEADLARAGLTEKQAKQEKINYQAISLTTEDFSNYVPGARNITIKVIYDVDNDIIVGTQMYGHHSSVMRIQAINALIWTKAKISDCAYLDVPYAPAFSKAVDIVSLLLMRVARK